MLLGSRVNEVRDAAAEDTPTRDASGIFQQLRLASFFLAASFRRGSEGVIYKLY